MSRRHVHFATGVPEALDKKGNVPGKSNSTSAAKNGISDQRGDIVVSDLEGAEATPPPTSDSTEETTKVISGMRANATVLIWVSVARSIEHGGLKWWRSDNGVVLTEGDAHGNVSMDWFERVEAKGTGEKLWTRAVDGD